MTLAISVRLLFTGRLGRPDWLLYENIIHLITTTYLNIAQIDVDLGWQVQ